MHEIAVPMYKADEQAAPRQKRPRPTREWAVEAYFAVLTLVIFGMAIALGAYAVLNVIPEMQKSPAPRHRQQFSLRPQLPNSE